MRLSRALWLATPLSLALMACGGSDETPTPAPVQPTTQAVNIQFALKAGNAVVSCSNDVAALGTGAISAKLHDARLYLHDVKLITNTGAEVPVTLAQNAWQYLNLAMLDFEDGKNACADGNADTRMVVEGTVPAGSYQGLVFQVGVPVSGTDAAGKSVSMNHSDPTVAAKPLDWQAMAWSWRAGRLFTKLEFDPAGGVSQSNGNTGSTWYVHLGSTGCTGSPEAGEAVNCTNPNRFPVRLNSFNAQNQQVVLDVASLLQNSNLSANGGGASGCMSGPTDPECAAVFARMDLNLTESAAGANDQGKPKGNGLNQLVFRAEAK